MSNNHLITQAELSKRFGISRTTQYLLRNRKGEARIPHHKIGARILYDPDEVLEWSRRRAMED